MDISKLIPPVGELAFAALVDEHPKQIDNAKIVINTRTNRNKIEE